MCLDIQLKCAVRDKKTQEEKEQHKQGSIRNEGSKDGFVENRRRQFQQNNFNRRVQQNKFEKGRNAENKEGNKKYHENTVKYAYRPKKAEIPVQNNVNNGTSNAKNGPNIPTTDKLSSGFKGKQNTNKYAVLADYNEEGMGKKINAKQMAEVDYFVKQKLQPTPFETSKWSHKLVNYYKESWERMIDKGDKVEDIEDNMELKLASWNIRGMGTVDKQDEIQKLIPENNLSILAILETRAKGKEVERICSKVFNRWNWTTNMSNCIQEKTKFFCSFVYAANHGKERAELWKDLAYQKKIVNGGPWVLLGDFNVTLHSHEHSYHCLCIITIPNGLKKKKLNMEGFQMYKVVKTTKKLKKSMKRLNLRNGNLFTKVLLLKDKLKEWQSKIDEDPFNTTFREEEAVILKEYKEAMGRMHKSIIESICDENEVRYFGEDVPGQFLKHFQNFLGKEKAAEMIKDITDKEIKEAIFDIDNDKSPGLDGYTSRFFTKAWICSAVKEFFQTGKLLKEMNATLISLIPKMNTLNKVSDLYKCISKIGLFLKVLEKFGFHEVMVNWIMTCISTSAFSICVNGQSHGYFKGARGLRQGDAISPYLFTLVMEVLNFILIKNIKSDGSFKYHPGCKDIQLTHLCFADDLMVFCNGDVQSMSIVKKSLNEFSNMSGLLPNLKKAQSSLENYWPSIYLIPKTVVKEIDKVMKNFLWSHGGNNCGKAKIAWKVVYRPKDQGGLGIKPLREWNEVLLMTHIWKIIEQKQNLWVQWVNRVKLKGRNIWDIEIDANDSWGWKMLMGLREKIKPRIFHNIGNGGNTSVWFDKWDHNGPLSNFRTKRDIYDARFKIKDMVVDLIEETRWKWPSEWFDRNSRIFKNGNRDEETMIKIVKNEIKEKLASLIVRRSVAVKRIFEEWELLDDLGENGKEM
ncbi:pentatricopeptide repeat-containing protein [Tanacetum coccineum]